MYVYMYVHVYAVYVCVCVNPVDPTDAGHNTWEACSGESVAETRLRRHSEDGGIGRKPQLSGGCH